MNFNIAECKMPTDKLPSPFASYMCNKNNLDNIKNQLQPFLEQEL